MAAVVITVTVALLLLSCGLVFSLSGGPKLIGIGGPPPTATPKLTHVPDFTGKQYAEAQTLAPQFHLRVKENQVNSDLPPGTVIQQDKAPNSAVPWDTLVTLQVSEGLAQVAVPNVVNKPYDQACIILTGTDYNLGCDLQSQEYSASIPVGNVIRTDPKAGTMVDPGKTTVHLVVSKGPAPVTVTPTPTCAATPAVTPTPTPVSGC
jgi:serine/threonine-protein kinase